MPSPKTTAVTAALAAMVLVPAITSVSAGAPSRARTAAVHTIAARTTAARTPRPPMHLTGRRMQPRHGAVPPGTAIPSAELFGNRVFARAQDGFALANTGDAQYPAVSADGGRTWRIAGPQLHVDAADGPEGVGYVGAASPKTLFAYGSSVIDVTTNGGRDWEETFMGELVMAVVPGPRNELVAYVQQSVSNDHINPAVTWQYISRDGGRHWSYSTALGGLS
jgi:hypothetical protein